MERNEPCKWSASVARGEREEKLLYSVSTYPDSRPFSQPRSPRDARCTRRDSNSPGKVRTRDNPAETGRKLRGRSRSVSWSLKLIEGGLARGTPRIGEHQAARKLLSPDIQSYGEVRRFSRERPLQILYVCHTFAIPRERRDTEHFSI